MRIIFFLLLIHSHFISAQNKAEVVFRIPEKDLIPEGITYDPAYKTFYVGSIQKKKVIRISSDGKISDFIPSTRGLEAVLGMRVNGQKIWICNNSPEYDSLHFLSSVHIFDLKTGKLSKAFTKNDGTKHLFNDLVISADGTGYVTDSNGGGIYRIKISADSIETFIKPGTLRYPNGICLSPDETRLIVSTGDLGVVSIDLKSKAINPIQHEKFFLFGIDGLYRYNNSLIGIQNVTYPESILEFKCDSSFHAVERIEPKAIQLKEFDTPTTGVIVDNYFYFIANSQLIQIIGTHGKVKKPDQLSQTLIMRIKLD